jgi:hypothetical protein
MMSGRYLYRPAQATPVHTLAAARTEAQRFASRLSLRVDEVLQFKRNFYTKLVDTAGNGATEVLVDPSTGIVSTEYGPAMMWNTRYGMMNSSAAATMMGSYGTSMMGGAAMMGSYSGGGSTDGYNTRMMSDSGTGMMGGYTNSGATASRTATVSFPRRTPLPSTG